MLLDATDAQILDLLQRDGRMSVVEIAQGIGRGESTTRDRVARLQAIGVLRGQRAVVDLPRVGFGLRARVLANGPGHPDIIAGALAGLAHVTEAVMTTGTQAYQIDLTTDTRASLQACLGRLEAMGFRDLDTRLVLQEVVEARPLELHALLHGDSREAREAREQREAREARDAREVREVVDSLERVERLERLEPA